MRRIDMNEKEEKKTMYKWVNYSPMLIHFNKSKNVIIKHGRWRDSWRLPKLSESSNQSAYTHWQDVKTTATTTTTERTNKQIKSTTSLIYICGFAHEQSANADNVVLIALQKRHNTTLIIIKWMTVHSTQYTSEWMNDSISFDNN